jgi:hypothetical protein
MPYHTNSAGAAHPSTDAFTKSLEQYKMECPVGCAQSTSPLISRGTSMPRLVRRRETDRPPIARAGGLAKSHPRNRDACALAEVPLLPRTRAAPHAAGLPGAWRQALEGVASGGERTPGR